MSLFVRIATLLKTYNPFSSNDFFADGHFELQIKTNESISVDQTLRKCSKANALTKSFLNREMLINCVS